MFFPFLPLFSLFRALLKLDNLVYMLPKQALKLDNL